MEDLHLNGSRLFSTAHTFGEIKGPCFGKYDRGSKFVLVGDSGKGISSRETGENQFSHIKRCYRFILFSFKKRSLAF